MVKKDKKYERMEKGLLTFDPDGRENERTYENAFKYRIRSDPFN